MPQVKTSSYALVAKDGHVAVLHLIDGASLADAIVKFSQSTFAPVDFFKIDPADIPQSREYRDAWRADKQTRKFSHDMDAAREIHRRRLRKFRARLFREADAEHARASDTNNAQLKAAAEEKRKRLRDAPAHADIDAAKTVDELRLVNPISDLDKKRTLWRGNPAAGLWSDKHGPRLK